MSISLSKNQTISLSKVAPVGLSNVVVGLGWDPAKKGFGLFGGNQSIDCDAFCFGIDNNRRIVDTIYFGNLSGLGGSVRHMGDNLTGDGDGDDEQILINLNAVPSNISVILIAVNIYRGKQKHQDFGGIDNAFIRLVDARNNTEICKYNLSGKQYAGYTTLAFGALYRNEMGQWDFKAIGQGDNAGSIGEFSSSYMHSLQ